MTKYEAIFRRKSVRRYKEEEIPEEILEKIRHYGAHAVGIRKEVRIKWKVYRASDHNVKGMFQVKAPYYAALYSEVCEDCRIHAGCLMEQLVLWLHTMGIASCYQGGARLKHDEEEQMELMMILAFGYPSEALERSFVDFKRAELKKLVKTNITPGKVQKKLLEAARLAP